MCEFISFKIEQTDKGLVIRTAQSLSDHSEIEGGGYEGEWTENGIEIRIPDDVSDHIKNELETFVKKTYRTRKNMANKLIVEWLGTGEMPGHFWEHSKMNDKKLRLFACDCAARVLPIFEKEHPEDKRPRKCIGAARAFANGKATKKQLDVAKDAAWAAAWAATGDAAKDAAWDAARAAARDAAWDAAKDAAWDAARAAARDAVGAAAGDAVGYAAWAAAWAAEKKWQAAQLLKYINQEEK